MGLRQLSKQATRERVLHAAGDLFDEVGYDDAAIREIARRAGVSVGSVFTTFGGKADILSAVMNDRLEGLYAELERLIPHLRGGTADRLRSIMAVHYGFETRRLRLFVSYIAASYVWRSSEGITPLGANVRLRGMLADTLRQGIERGDVRAEADIATCVDVLVASYIWNYRLACQHEADSDALIALMDRQVGLLFDGVVVNEPASLS